MLSFKNWQNPKWLLGRVIRKSDTVRPSYSFCTLRRRKWASEAKALASVSNPPCECWTQTRLERSKFWIGMLALLPLRSWTGGTVQVFPVPWRKELGPEKGNLMWLWLQREPMLFCSLYVPIGLSYSMLILEPRADHITWYVLFWLVWRYDNIFHFTLTFSALSWKKGYVCKSIRKCHQCSRGRARLC